MDRRQDTRVHPFPRNRRSGAGFASDDPEIRAEARFARQAVWHLSRGYDHHFGSAQCVYDHADRFAAIGEMTADGIAQVGRALGLDPVAARGIHAQAAPESAPELSPRTHAALKDALRPEYAIIAALRAVAAG